MVKKYLICLIVFLLTGTAVVAVQDALPLSSAETQSVLEKMSAELSALRSLSARFRQERHLVLFNDVLRSQGYFFFQRPGRVRWEYTQPYAALIILRENQQVGRYDVQEGRAVRVEATANQAFAQVLRQVSQWLQGDLAAVEEEFEISLSRSDRYRLTLIPRSQTLSSLIAKLEFEVDSESFLVHSLRLTENEDNFTVILFEGQKTDNNLSDELFDLDNPKPVQIKQQ